MAFINKISNYLLGAAAITVPTGVWESLIIWFNSWVVNYGWAIIVFTILLKLVLSPIDFFNKKLTDKNTKMQAIIKPEVDKIQRQYANNKQVMNQKISEVYKKNSYNLGGSCFFMIFNLGLTLFIFISLFGGLNSMASYKVGYQYQEMEATYIEYFDEGYSQEEIDEAVLAKYNEVKESWLWVSNVWKPDNPWTKSVSTFDEFVSMAGITYKTELAEGEVETFKIRLQEKKATDKVNYENVMAAVEGQNVTNGYLIIPFLAIIATSLSLLAAQGKLKFKKKKADINPEAPAIPTSGGWIMVVILGGLMGYITITYNSVFALYILVSSLFGLAMTPLFNWGIKKMSKLEDEKKVKKLEATTAYRRKK
ncbi:MAG: YidC/Oxa1 family membrane protein insertase [Clostridia bacterium]|nr:YidC/Oxa1 family membrane protein insertase [Clostridia bacterium]